MKQIPVLCAHLICLLRQSTGRVRFVSEAEGEPLGYFVSVRVIRANVPVNPTDFDPIFRFTADMVESYGGLRTETELLTAEGEVLGHFIPETSRELKVYANAANLFPAAVLNQARTEGGWRTQQAMWQAIDDGLMSVKAPKE